jgi:hypothetical protein
LVASFRSCSINQFATSRTKASSPTIGHSKIYGSGHLTRAFCDTGRIFHSRFSCSWGPRFCSIRCALVHVIKLKHDLVLLFLDNDSHFLENHTGCFCEVEAFCTLGSEMSKRTVSDEFDGLDAIEKAAIEAALNRCRALARQIESKLRNKRPEHFVDKLSLADFCVSVERAADILKQKGDRSTPDLLPP